MKLFACDDEYGNMLFHGWECVSGRSQLFGKNVLD